MKKINILPFVILALVPIYSFAKSDNANSQSQGNLNSATGTGTGASYQNQVQTQNKGEEQQLQVSTQQQSEGEESNGKSNQINQHSSDVAKYVQQLLDSKTLTGGIGEQVREVAKLQNQSQENLGDQLETINNRNKLVRMILGTDYKAVKLMNHEMERNQERVRELTELKSKLTSLTDQEGLQALIDSLNSQNIAIKDTIVNEEGQFSLFGWLFKLLNK